MKAHRVITWFCCALVTAALAAPAAAWDVYANSQDGTAIPDVNKPDRNGDGNWPDANDASCWQAAAANLLGAGGWGIGAGQQANAQTRANRIYNTLVGDLGFQACGNAGQAMNYWLQTYGMQQGTADYDANNTYTNVIIVQRTLGCPDYKKLLDDLAAQQEKYATVLWTLPATTHFLTLVGGDYDNCQNPANNKQSVWHDSDRIQGGAADNAYTNVFQVDGTWDLPGYVANDADEYDQLAVGLRLEPVEAHYYHVGRYHEPQDGGSAMFIESGEKADEYDDPVFETDLVLRIDNTFDPSLEKKISLIVDYAESANMTVEEQIYLLDDQSVRWDPAITHGPEDGQLLFEWLLPYQPHEERIVFPDDKYKYLDLDVPAGDDVIGWELSTYCVPEPAALALTALSGLALLKRRRRRS